MFLFAAPNSGVRTIGEAVSEYTATNGVFGVCGVYIQHPAAAETLRNLKGSWYYKNYGYYITIRGTTYTDFLDDGGDSEHYLNITGDIVECTDAAQDSGILYIKVIRTQGIFSAGKYVAVAWQNKDDGSIEFATGTAEKDTLAGIKTAYNDISAFPGNSFDTFEREAAA